MKNRNILISGAGIAGPALAWWLQHYGFEPVVIERAAAYREGGYAIDVRGAAVDVARRMGLLERLKQERVDKGRIAFVDKHTATLARFNSRALQKLSAGTWVEIMRDDLGKLFYEATKTKVEYIFDDTIQQIDQNGEGCFVRFEKARPRHVDLVMGADGLHSRVRQLIFGDDDVYERSLGYYVAIFSIDNYLDLDINDSGYMYNVPGKMAAIIHYTTATYHKTFAFFIFKAQPGLIRDINDINGQRQLLEKAFAREEWEVPRLLQKMRTAPDFYFDTVSQIRMPAWSKERVALVGDAGYCPSLLTGQGTSLAMIGAYILAGELKAAHGDHKSAFENYELRCRRFVKKEQKIGFSSNLLVPDTRFGIFMRNKLTGLNKLLFLVPRIVWKKMAERFMLPLNDY